MADDRSKPLYVDPQILARDLGDSLSAASRAPTAPDDEANLREASRRLGIPLDTARTNPAETKRALEQDSFNPTDYATRFPSSAKYLADQENALIAKDDVQQLSEVEKTLRQQVLDNMAGTRTPDTARGAVQRAMPEYAAERRERERVLRTEGFAAASALKRQQDQRRELLRSTGLIGPTQQPEATPGNILSGLRTSASVGFQSAKLGMAQQLNDLLTEGDSEQTKQYNRQRAQLDFRGELATPEFDTDVARWTYGGFSSLAQTAPAIGLSVATGSPALGLGLMGVQTYGESYGRYRGRGASKGMASLGATGEATVEVFTELLPMKFAVDRLGKAGLTEFFAGFLGRDMLGEQIATLAQDAIDTAIANPTKTWSDYLAERPEAAIQTAFATLVQSGTLAAIGEGAGRLAGTLDRNQAAVDAANNSAQQLQELMAAAAASMTRQRDPQSFAQLVQEAAEDSGTAPAELFIDASRLVELVPEEVLAQLPSVQEQLDEALATDGAVAIPIGEATTAFAGTGFEQELVRNARTSPDAWTAAEAEEGRDLLAQLEQEAQTIIAEQTEAQAWEESSKAVFDTLMGELTTAGHFAPDVNRAYATLVRNFYTVQAARSGTTPQELYARFPLTVSSRAPGTTTENTLEQEGPSVVPSEKPGALRVRGVHYSTARRPTLDGRYFGTGLKGAERARLQSLPKDSPLRSRVLAYVDEGFGIRPEQGVGDVAHAVDLDNIYDVAADPLGIWWGNPDANAREQAVLDAGYDGYYAPAAMNLGGNKDMGVVALLGEAAYNVPTREFGGGRAAAPVRNISEMQQALEEFRDHPDLQYGAPSPRLWGVFTKMKAPELYEKLAPTGIFEGEEGIYKSDLIAKAQGQEVFAQSLSTRVPTAVRATEDALANVLAINFDSVLADEKTLAKNAATLKGLVNMRPTKARKPAKIVEQFVEHVVDNLLFLHDLMPANQRDRARQWYDGGRRMVEAWSKRYGISEMQGAAAIAVLSPQNDWFQNVSAAERTADIIFGMRDFQWDEAMSAEATRILGGKADEKMELARGQKLADVLDRPDVAARWVRVFDQTHNNRAFNVLTPEGGAAGLRTVKSGAPATMAWKTYDNIAAAISIYLDGRAENVFYQLGREHKVRNFYNNIFDPKSEMGFATIDTHAVAAALLRPLAGADTEVTQNFGGAGSASSSITGLSGTYPIYLEAYRRAAEQRGLLPREMQSITWEAVRGLFEGPRKNAMKSPAEGIWERYRTGEIDQAQAQAEIVKLAGDITPPTWTEVEFNDTPGRTYEGDAQRAIDGRGDVQKAEQPEARVMFEVAPDPNDTELTEQWNALTDSERLEISQQVAAQVVPKVLAELSTTGDFVMQLGGYMGATNPSMTLRLDRPELAVQAAKLLGYALAQDSMMVVTDSQAVGTEPVGAVTLRLPEGYGAAQVEGLYNRLFELQENGEPLVGGHTTANGQMTILNYSALSDEELARRIDEHLAGAFDIAIDQVYSAFPQKSEYGYGSDEQEGATTPGRSPAQRRPDSLRGEATQLVREALETRGQAGTTQGEVAQDEVFNQAPIDASLDEVLRLTPDEYLDLVNPTGERSDEDGSARLVRGDLTDPQEATVIRELDGGVTIERDAEGNVYARQGGDTIGEIINYGDEVNANVLPEARGAGVATAMVAEFIRANPVFNAGSLTAGGEAAVRAAFRQLQAERGEVLNQSVPQTETENFKRWFGDSKVVDAEGKPLVVYHGTQNDFTQFLPGAYFTEHPDEAAAYTGAGATMARGRMTGKYRVGKDNGASVGAEVRYAYDGLDALQNPMVGEVVATDDLAYRFDGDGKWTVFTDVAPDFNADSKDDDHVVLAKADASDLAADRVAEYEEAVVRATPGGQGGGNVMPVYLSIKNPVKLSALAGNRLAEKAGNDRAYIAEQIANWEAQGYDGIVTESDEASVIPESREGLGGVPRQWVAFRPEQIKSAIGNNGNFDPADPNTLKQTGQARATFNPATLDIALLEKADLSSFLHETGHFFFEMQAILAAQADAPQAIVDDMRILLDHVGFEGTAAEWLAQPVNARREAHETIAESFEQYLFTGKAPTPEMQPLFQRFRSWMVSVYRSLQEFLAINKRASLNPDIAAVFDRMLASEKAISDALAVRQFEPMFRSAEEAGLTPEAFAAYQADLERQQADALDEVQARTMRDLKWLDNARGRKLKELQKEAAAQRKAVRDEVTAEVNAQPVYKAMEFLKYGRVEADGEQIQVEVTKAAKLNITEVQAMYPEGELGTGVEWRSLGYGKYGMLSDAGLHPDTVAEMFGFRSGRQLIAALLEAEPKAELINGLTDQRMLERHGDISSPQAMQEAANEALANEARARLVATELAALTKATGKPGLLARAARQAAEQMVAAKPVRNLRPDLAAASAARARKAAEAAMAKGDTAAAAAAKRTEILQIQLERVQRKAQQEHDKALRDFKKIFKGTNEKVAKSRDIGLVNAARGVLARYGLAPNAAAANARSYAELLANYDGAMAADIASILQGLPAPVDFRELTVEQFRGMRDVVNGLYYLARRTKQVEIDGQKFELDAVADELVAATTERAGGEIPPLPGYASTPTERDKWVAGLQSAKAALTRVEFWADNMGPAFKRYIWNPVSEATTRMRTKRTELVRQYRDLLRAIEKGITYNKIDAPELGPVGFTFNAGKSELLHAILHTGNKSNLTKLLLGRGWGTLDANGQLDTRKWDLFVTRMINEGVLTKADFDFAQGVWDLLETVKKDAQAAHKEMYGYYFNEVTADPIQTPWGEYRGGYVPALADSLSSPEMAQKREQEDLLHAGNSFMFPTTGKGFTQSRVFFNKPLELDLRAIGSHLDKVSRFAYLEPTIRDVNQIISNKRVARALNGANPGAISDMLTPWLQRTARQSTSMPGKNPKVNRFFNGLRSRTGMVFMFGNVVNTLQQLTGFSLAALKVPAPKMLRATARYLANPPSMRAEVAAKSPWLAERMDSQSYAMQDQIEEILTNPGVYTKTVEFAKRNAYFLQQAMQNVMDPIVWTGAYDHALAKGVTEREAIRYADEAVRTTQGSFAPEDVAGFEVQSPFVRLFTQFYGYFNMWGNLLGNEASKAVREMGFVKSSPRLLFIWFAGVAVPSVVAEIIARGLPDDEDDEDGDGTLDEWMALLFGSQFKSLAATVPVLGHLTVLGANMLDDQVYNDRFNISPALSAAESAVRGGASLVSGDLLDEDVKKREVRDILTLIGLGTGLPVAPVARAAGYAADVGQGRAEPEGAVDVGAGLLLGR